MNRSDSQIHVEHRDGWLLFDAPVTGVLASASWADAGLWELLRLNAGLPGPIKLALPLWRTDLRICAEIPLAPGEDQERPIREVCARIEALTGSFAAGATQPGGHEGAPANRPADLPSLCRETGWEFVERSDGTLAVTLAVQGAFFQAQMHVDPDTRVRLWVDLRPDLDGAPAACRRAVAALLLRTCACIRFVRAAASGWAARFEVMLGPAPQAIEIDEALKSLSIACRFCAREVELLGGDDAVAQAFLTRAAAADRRVAPNNDVEQPEPSAP